MPVPRNTGRAETALRGLNEFLVIDTAPAGATSLIGTLLKDAGALTVAGTYDCYVNAPGIASLDIYLAPSALAGTVTPSAFVTYADKVTSKTAVAGFSAFVGTTQQTGTATLKGELQVIVRIVVAAASAVTMTRAEVNGK